HQHSDQEDKPHSRPTPRELTGSSQKARLSQATLPARRLSRKALSGFPTFEACRPTQDERKRPGPLSRCGQNRSTTSFNLDNSTQCPDAKETIEIIILCRKGPGASVGSLAGQGV